MDNIVDKQIEKLMTTVKDQRAAVNAAEKVAKRSWETNCSFKSEAFNSLPVNIQTANIVQVHDIMMNMVIKRGASSEAAAILGLVGFSDATYGGFTFDNWVSDLKKRIAIITLTEKKKKLDEMEARLDKLLSPEKRREMELQALTKEIDDL